MKPEIVRILNGADTSRWTPGEAEYGARTLAVGVPANCHVLEMTEVAPRSGPREATRQSIHRPLGCPPLPETLQAARGPGRV